MFGSISELLVSHFINTWYNAINEPKHAYWSIINNTIWPLCTEYLIIKLIVAGSIFQAPKAIIDCFWQEGRHSGIYFESLEETWKQCIFGTSFQSFYQVSICFKELLKGKQIEKGAKKRLFLNERSPSIQAKSHHVFTILG